MKYSRTVTLKDGRACVVRNATERDAEAVLNNYILTHGQTEFLASYPEESTLTAEQEAAFLKQQEERAREVLLVAEVDGIITGTAGVNCVREKEKTRHRATFGIGIDRAWWGVGVGRALTESCVECARAASYSQLELEVVADNERAFRLYESLGFVEYGRNPRAFRTRAGRWQETVHMLLNLDR